MAKSKYSFCIKSTRAESYNFTNDDIGAELPITNEEYQKLMDMFFAFNGKDAPHVFSLHFDGFPQMDITLDDLSKANMVARLLHMMENKGLLELVIRRFKSDFSKAKKQPFFNKGLSCDCLYESIEHVLHDNVEGFKNIGYGGFFYTDRCGESRLHYTPKNLRELASKLPCSWLEYQDSFKFSGLCGRLIASILPVDNLIDKHGYLLVIKTCLLEAYFKEDPIKPRIDARVFDSIEDALSYFNGIYYSMEKKEDEIFARSYENYDIDKGPLMMEF